MCVHLVRRWPTPADCLSTSACPHPAEREHTKETMKITVIGAGAIGSNLARRLSESGHDVVAADARGPEAVAEELLAAGVRADEVDAAVADRDVIALSVPFSVQSDLADLLAGVPDDTIVVDTSNYYPFMMGPVEAVDNGQVESEWSQEKLRRPVVKAWNAALAATQQTQSRPKVFAVQSMVSEDRRTRRSIMTGCPPIAVSASCRRYRERTRTDSPSQCPSIPSHPPWRSLTRRSPECGRGSSPRPHAFPPVSS
ncbi:NADPH-dependent F420 reductase [Rhodococcus opacus]|uniref:NAD(P)-binding domain-containing protein n=1 Tax=Rhodococcus opacus TaxID=37919 RepID=A0AAX3YP01_RHOOP|nr:NAD(P)-binding domain-containing protein [Rhodococcus opacus]WLF51051.1 NAD(P)-binding domain-containing protein [Rhodococcus opacus]